MTNVEDHGSWYASSGSLCSFVCVHVEEKRELDGMELLYAISLGLEFARMYGTVV